MGVGVEEEDGVGGPAGRSEGEGDGEEVEEETEEWLITSTRPCRMKDTHTGAGVFNSLILERITSRMQSSFLYLVIFFFNPTGVFSLFHIEAHT